MALFAPTLTLLFHLLTAVISANKAIHYLHHLIPASPIILTTAIPLSIFGVLTIAGVLESDKVAIRIFSVIWAILPFYPALLSSFNST